MQTSNRPAGPGDDELPALTALRGVAALWVMVFHASIGFAPRQPTPWTEWVSFGREGVALFFMLSGYVLSLRYAERLCRLPPRAVARFWWLRLGRVLPMHFVVMAALLVVHAFGIKFILCPEDARSFIANLFLVQQWDRQVVSTWNPITWTLSTELLCYLCFPLLAPLLCRLGRSAALGGLLLTTFLNAEFFAPQQGFFRLQGYPYGTVAATFSAFATGCCWWAFWRGVSPPRGGCRGTLAAAALVLGPLFPRDSTAIGLMVAVLGAALVGMLSYERQSAARWWSFAPLAFLGRISYSLYLVHYHWRMIDLPLFAGLQRLGFRATTPGLFYVMQGLYMASAVALAALGYRFVERPARDWFRRHAPWPVRPDQGSKTLGP